MKQFNLVVIYEKFNGKLVMNICSLAALAFVSEQEIEKGFLVAVGKIEAPSSRRKIRSPSFFLQLNTGKKL